MAKGPYRHIEGFRKPEKIEEGGIIRLSGKFLLDHGEEVIGLMKHEGEAAEKKNPHHRITRIEKVDGGGGGGTPKPKLSPQH